VKYEYKMHACNEEIHYIFTHISSLFGQTEVVILIVVYWLCHVFWDGTKEIKFCR